MHRMVAHSLFLALASLSTQRAMASTISQSPGTEIGRIQRSFSNSRTPNSGFLTFAPIYPVLATRSIACWSTYLSPMLTWSRAMRLAARSCER